MDEKEFDNNIRCCAAPIKDNYDNFIGTVGITSTIITFNKNRIPEIAQEVKYAAQKISVEMGYQ